MIIARRIVSSISSRLKRILRLPRVIVEYFRARPTQVDLEKYLSWAETRRGTFLTMHERPRRASQVGLSPHLIRAKFAIVIQGPVARTDDFTLETCRLYRKLYPDARLILSTWDTERLSPMDAFLEAGVEIVYSPLPTVSGYWNINYQIVSTRAGIELAVAEGAQYLLKTRSDQRFYATGLVDYLGELIRAFPLAENEARNQQGRLVVINLGTCKYRAYAVSDMFLFGHAKDVQQFWNQPLDDRIHKKRSFSTMREEVLFRAPEIYFLENYLKTHQRKLKFTLADSWEVLARHFCVADSATLDLVWRKYSPHEEYRYREYAHSRTSEMLDFKDWLLLHAGKTPSAAEELVLDMPFGAPLDGLR